MVVALTFAALGLGAASTPDAGAGPLDDADATVQTLREEADRAAQEYFDTLAQAASLDVKIQRLAARLPGLVKRRVRLHRRAEQRAVAAYRRAGTPLAAIIDSSDALSAARRRELLARLNASDAAVIAQLTRASRELRVRRQELRGARAAQDGALADLRARGRDIDAKLGAALDRRNELQAQATAAAATATTSPTAPSTSPTLASDPAATPAPPPSAPTTAPPGYHPTPGTHPHHDDPFLSCTRAREAGGNYAAVNPAGPYLGAYQFLQSTWNGGANHAGRLELVGVPPNLASPFDQDEVAWSIYQWRGKAPWGNLC
jgi:hypothetical protein